MIKLSRVTNALAGTAMFAGVLSGCAQTPNDVSMTVKQGQCVTSAFPGYESVATAYSQAFPLNANLPAQSPYCLSVTLANNNSGSNANNIQINQSGLVASVTNYANLVSSYSMIDFNAAGIAQSSFSNTYQQIANFSLFDPANCVTTQGSKVNTLTMNGGQCTFYLQLSGESFPVGVYPITLALNYTNGNSNYTLISNLNQRVNMYLGGNFSGNVAITNAQSTTPTANSIISANSPEQYAVSAMARDAFGNLYTGDIFGGVYKYSGSSINSWTQLSSGFVNLNAPITAMTADNYGNLYLANSRGELAQITQNLQVNSLGTLPATYPSSMQVESGGAANPVLLVAAANSIYSCSLANISTSSCLLLENGPDTLINQMLATNTITVATNLNVYQYTPATPQSLWTPIAGGLPGESVDSIAVYDNSLSSPSVTTWYAGISQTESSNSSVYFESSGAVFAPLSSSSGAIVSGSVNILALDSAQGVFVGGLSLSSSDFSGASYLAYIPSNYLGLTAYPWTAISGISGGSIATLQSASQLTPY